MGEETPTFRSALRIQSGTYGSPRRDERPSGELRSARYVRHGRL
jgi:hypothetical protein